MSFFAAFCAVVLLLLVVADLVIAGLFIALTNLTFFDVMTGRRIGQNLFAAFLAVATFWTIS